MKVMFEGNTATCSGVSAQLKLSVAAGSRMLTHGRAWPFDVNVTEYSKDAMSACRWQLLR